jgi:hypothetical protein
MAIASWTNMKKIPLTQGKFALVNDEDYERVNKHRWCAAKQGNVFYAQRCITLNKIERMEKMHRFILRIPFGERREIDHKDGNGLNNTKENLRVSSRSQNTQNGRLSKRNTSGYKGVHEEKSSGKWIAAIMANGIRKNLGRFDNRQEAAKMYDAAAKILHGNFAKTNEDLRRSLVGRGRK